MTRTELLATIRNIALALIALAILGGSAAGAGMAVIDRPNQILFNDAAALDTTQAVVIPGERWCPKVRAWGDDDTTWGQCMVDLVEGARPTTATTWRPDWDHAMMACYAAGFSVRECVESVGDGEF